MLNKYKVTITKGDSIRTAYYETSEKIILKSKISRKINLGHEEYISKIECINMTDDIEMIIGNKRMLTFQGEIIFTSESILKGVRDDDHSITHVNIKNLVRRSQNEFYDTLQRVTILLTNPYMQINNKILHI